MAKQDWVWLGHPQHFICARDCRFHMATFVNGHIVSTIGEYLPDAPIREALASARGIALTSIGDNRLADYMKKIGFEEISYGYKYETMVFKAVEDKEVCCGYRVTDWSEICCSRSNTAEMAKQQHYEMCEQVDKELTNA